MEQLLPYLLNTALGAGGGWLGNMLKKNGLGMVGNLLSGAVGGNVLPLILQAAGLFGAAPADGSGGGLNIMGLLSALVGGGLGSLVGGLFKKAPAT